MFVVFSRSHGIQPNTQQPPASPLFEDRAIRPIAARTWNSTIVIFVPAAAAPPRDSSHDSATGARCSTTAPSAQLSGSVGGLDRPCKATNAALRTVRLAVGKDSSLQQLFSIFVRAGQVTSKAGIILQWCQRGFQMSV